MLYRVTLLKKQKYCKRILLKTKGSKLCQKIFSRLQEVQPHFWRQRKWLPIIDKLLWIDSIIMVHLSPNDGAFDCINKESYRLMIKVCKSAFLAVCMHVNNVPSFLFCMHVYHIQHLHACISYTTPHLRKIFLHFSLNCLTKVHCLLQSPMHAPFSLRQLLHRALFHPLAAPFLLCFCPIYLSVDVPHFHVRPEKIDNGANIKLFNNYFSRFRFHFAMKILF